MLIAVQIEMTLFWLNEPKYNLRTNNAAKLSNVTKKEVVYVDYERNDK